MHRSSIERFAGASLPPSQVLASALARPATSNTLRRTSELYLAQRALLSLRGVLNQLPNLEALWVNANALHGLDGLAGATRLRALYAHSNRIDDLGDSLATCSCLGELTLHDNRLSDLEHAIDSLRHLEHLHTLTLHDNPATNEADYRARVIAALPALSLLDNRPVTSTERVAAEARFGDSGTRKPPAALAFGTRGRNGMTLRAHSDKRSAGTLVPPASPSLADSGRRAAGPAPVAERIQAEAALVRRRQLALALSDTYASFTAAASGAAGAAGPLDSTAADLGGGLVVSALINLTDPGAHEGPVPGAVRASMAARGVPAAALLLATAHPAALSDTAAGGSEAAVESHLRQSLVPLPLASYATQRVAPITSSATANQLSTERATATTRRAPTRTAAAEQLRLSMGGTGSGNGGGAAAGGGAVGDVPRRLDATEVRRLVMHRTGVRLGGAPESRLLQDASPGRRGAAASDSGGAAIRPDGSLGEWDKLRLLRLLRSAAGPGTGACVTGAQLRDAIVAMADYGCVAVVPPPPPLAPRGGVRRSSELADADDDEDPTRRLDAFLARQCRIMDPRGADRFGPREFVDAQDTGVYQVCVAASGSGPVTSTAGTPLLPSPRRRSLGQRATRRRQTGGLLEAWRLRGGLSSPTRGGAPLARRDPRPWPAWRAPLPLLLLQAVAEEAVALAAREPTPHWRPRLREPAAPSPTRLAAARGGGEAPARWARRRLRRSLRTTPRSHRCCRPSPSSRCASAPSLPPRPRPARTGTLCRRRS